MNIQKRIKDIGSSFSKGIIIGAGFLTILGVAGIAYASSLNVTAGETLTAEKWNSLVSSVQSSTDSTITETIPLQISANTRYNTGVAGADLTTGTYIVNVYVNDYEVGGQQYFMTYSGTMSWYGGTTNNIDTDEITLHRSGHGSNGKYVYLRTKGQMVGDGGELQLQIKGTQSTTGNNDYIFKFKKIF